jgi:AMIN domain
LPRFTLRIAALLVVGISLSGTLALGQSGAHQARGPALGETIATIRSLRLYKASDGPTVEIVASRPVTPVITKLDGPPRLVIDLPDSIVSLPRKRYSLQSDQISAVRIDQFENNPPVARAVVDLLAPTNYTWENDGNHLTIKLHPAGSAPKPETAEKPAEQPVPQPPTPAGVPSVPAFTEGIQPAAVPMSSGVSGAVMLAGSRIANGSAVTAGSDTAILRLARGGEVRVCPGATVSVTPSQNGRELMFGMSTGAIEMHYSLQNSADSVLTPDFRILLSGPGEFDYAVSADAHGNTCVQGLPGNTASAIVSELMGDGTYQVKPNETVVFRSGRLQAVDALGNCGCPEPRPEVMRASAEPPKEVQDIKASSVHLAQPGEQIRQPEHVADPADHSQGVVPASQVSVSVVPSDPVHPETAPLPKATANDMHVEVEAPFVFRATDAAPSAPIQEAAALPVMSFDPPPLPATIVLPPENKDSQSKPRHHGFFGKLRGFFSSVFG